MRLKVSFLFFVILIFTGYSEAHEGIFLRFSVGSGFYVEQSSLNQSGIPTPAKNHALGWGFNEKFSIQISDFGGLPKNKAGEYDYINLDALGLGLTYYMPHITSVTLSSGQGKVTLARNW